MSRRYISCLAALGAAMALASSPAQAQFVATIFIDPCGVEMPLFTSTTIKVWVCAEGPIADGLTTAELRIQGLPSGWLKTVRPNPAAAVVDGDLFGDGVRIVFPACQPGVGQYLELFAVDILPTDFQTDVLLAVAATNPPSDPNFPCPFVTKCDATFSKFCVNGFGAWINPREHGCPLAVENRTWGQVKSLYD